MQMVILKPFNQLKSRKVISDGSNVLPYNIHIISNLQYVGD